VSEDQLTPLPDSFVALYGGASSHRARRLTLPMDEVRARYELCEDLAGHLVSSAQALHHDDGLAEEDVLLRCLQALQQPASGLQPGEGAWVVQRLAELLRWTCPDLSA
jgi:hypothetical protein